MKDFVKKVYNFISNARAWPGSVLRKALKTLLGQASRLVTVEAILVWAFVNGLPAFASRTGGSGSGGGDIGSSVLATGTEQLVQDVTSWLLVVAPLVTVVAVIYYLIRKTVADEMDHKKWNTRITTAIICCIGVVAASLIINVIVGYYQ